MQVNMLALHYHLNEKNILYFTVFCFVFLLWGEGINLKIHG